MNISKGLALKSLGALGAATAAGLGLGLENSPLRNALGLDGEIKIKTMAEKIGLNCSSDSDKCEIIDGKFNVLVEPNKKLVDATKSSNSSGKIKFEENQEGYNQKFKFTVIDGDIELTGNGSSLTLEEFATYEIKEEGDGWYFSIKITAQEGKSRILGLPENCIIPAEEGKKVECELDAEKLKAINFEGKGNMVVNGGVTAKLTIKRVENGGAYDRSFGNEKLRFTFRPSESIVINGNSENAIKLLRGTDPEFKIKEVGNKLTLEKAWTRGNLGTFAIDAFKMNSSGNDWIITRGTAIIAMDENEELSVLEFKDSSLTITVEEDQEGYGQGFKFKFNKEVSLGSGINSNWKEKIKLLESDSFEIKTKEFGGDRKYFFKKK